MTAPTIPGHRFVGLINEGGSATVYRFIRESLGKEVAIKVLRKEALEHLTAEEFQAEARIMARLSGHPNIVTIHDHGTVDGGRPYLVMEYCPPPDLNERLRAAEEDRKRLGVAFVLEVGLLIAGAVETAHRAGVLHHDIKPANILLDGYGPKLTDFGISELLGGAGRAGEGVSIPWAPLEALDGRSTDIRSDVYSLAATLYTALSGRWPYEVPGAANDLADLMSRMRAGAPQPLHRSDVSPRLENALRRSLHPDPDRRHQHVLDLADDLALAGPPGWVPPQPQVPEATARAALELTVAKLARAGDRSDPHLTAPRGQVLATPPPPPVRPPETSAGVRSGTVETGTVPRRGGAPPAGGGDVDRTKPPASAPEAEQPPPRRARWVGAAVAVVAAAAAVVVLVLNPSDAPAPEPTRAFDPVAVNAGQPGAPAWTRTATSAVLTWQAPPDHQPGDEYQWRPATHEGRSAGATTTTQDPTATLTGVTPETRVCAQVWVLRGDVPSSRVLLTCDPEVG